MPVRVFLVKGMSCQSCVNAITDAIRRAVPGAKVAVDLHSSGLVTRGGLDEAVVQRATLSAGMDLDRLRQDLETHADQFDEILRRNHELAKNLQLTGTPAFIIGDAIIPGIIDMATMKNVIASARQRVPRDAGRPESASPR